MASEKKLYQWNHHYKIASRLIVLLVGAGTAWMAQILIKSSTATSTLNLRARTDTEKFLWYKESYYDFLVGEFTSSISGVMLVVLLCMLGSRLIYKVMEYQDGQGRKRSSWLKAFVAIFYIPAIAALVIIAGAHIVEWFLMNIPLLPPGVARYPTNSYAFVDQYEQMANFYGPFQLLYHNVVAAIYALLYVIPFAFVMENDRKIKWWIEIKKDPFHPFV